MNKSVKIAAIAYIVSSALSLLYVSILAWLDPREVMDLVGVSLPNADAISSIRGVYGGAGLTLAAIFVYFIRNHLINGISFLTLFWGFYAISRATTAFVDGPLGAFGNTWIRIESAFCMVGLVLLLLHFTKQKMLT